MLSEKKRKTKFLALSVSLSFMFMTLFGCYDLGEYEMEDEDDYSAYYETFGEIEGIFEGGKLSYDMEDSIFNPYTVEELDWEDEEDEVESKEYVYIIVPIERDLNIDSFALFVKGEESLHLSLTVHFLEPGIEMFENIKYLSSPDFREEDEVVNGQHQTQKVEIIYDDPPTEKAVGSYTVILEKDVWASFLLDDWYDINHEKHASYEAKQGSKMLIRVENNSGLNKGKMTRCPLTFVNLLVRAI